MFTSVKGFVQRRAVERASTAAVEWLDANLEQFRIETQRDQEGLPWKIKPLGELIFLLMILRRHGVTSRAADRMRAFALDDAARFDWHQLAAYDPSTATPLAMIAEFFTLEGRPLPFETDYFEFLRHIDFFEGMDRFPYREMDFAYSFARMGVPGYQEKILTWFGSTAFGRHQPVTRYTIDDVYSITHAIFYLTDVGLRPAQEAFPPTMLARLHRELVALTAMGMRSDNADVLGELLLCWIFTGLRPTPAQHQIFTAGIRRMLAGTTAEGAVAPVHDIKRRAGTGHATFAELYHTTLVAAILFGLTTKYKP